MSLSRTKHEAPQYRCVKVDAALEQRMQEIWKLEQTLKQRREGRASNDKSCWYIAKGIIGESTFKLPIWYLNLRYPLKVQIGFKGLGPRLR